MLNRTWEGAGGQVEEMDLSGDRGRCTCCSAGVEVAELGPWEGAAGVGGA